MLGTILLVVLVLAVIGGLPSWGYWGPNRNYGYGPSGILGVILVLVVIWLLLGHRL